MMAWSLPPPSCPSTSPQRTTAGYRLPRTKRRDQQVREARQQARPRHGRGTAVCTITYVRPVLYPLYPLYPPSMQKYTVSVGDWRTLLRPELSLFQFRHCCLIRV